MSGTELILNPDGSVYHLHLKPEQLARTVITVGDPGRVAAVSRYFDRVEHRVQNREFVTHTGYLSTKRLTVLSTGIGAGNIDIVLNELDILADGKSLDIIRIGTSGAVDATLPVDSFLVSQMAVGLDGLLHFYKSHSFLDETATEQFVRQFPTLKKFHPYFAQADKWLAKQFSAGDIHHGITLTSPGFYAPQGRKLRYEVHDEDFVQRLSSFSCRGLSLTNMEMETAAIYGLAGLLGHRAVSLNALLANRITGAFSENPSQSIDRLIRFVMERQA